MDASYLILTSTLTELQATEFKDNNLLKYFCFHCNSAVSLADVFLKFFYVFE